MCTVRLSLSGFLYVRTSHLQHGRMLQYHFRNIFMHDQPPLLSAVGGNPALTSNSTSNLNKYRKLYTCCSLQKQYKLFSEFMFLAPKTVLYITTYYNIASNHPHSLPSTAGKSLNQSLSWDQKEACAVSRICFFVLFSNFCLDVEGIIYYNKITKTEVCRLKNPTKAATFKIKRSTWSDPIGWPSELKIVGGEMYKTNACLPNWPEKDRGTERKE